MKAEELARELTLEKDFGRDLLEAVDVSKLDFKTQNVWLTYVGMRRSMEHFCFLHPEIGPLVRVLEGRWVLRRPRFEQPTDASQIDK